MVDDVRTDERFSNKADVTSGFVTKSIIAVPMKIEGEIIGVIEAVNKSGGGVFNHKDVEMLATLANSAAMAIQKSRLYADLNELFFSTVRAMADAIEAKDTYTRGHSERIRSFSLVIADEMGFSDAEKRNIEISALLHDIGKIGISEAVLCKQGKLTDAEFAEIKKHPTIGADMLSSIKQLRDTIPGIRHHQERYDGKGYPDGLAGSAIPMFARIIAVADTFDAMTSDRPYRAAMPDHDALAELERFSGIQFDPDCVAAFANGYRKGLIISQWSEKQKKQGA
jgi:HD-GYP domain-containing protein (c-di-GMP phosphodiesterase class II)